jgi:galactokinase
MSASQQNFDAKVAPHCQAELQSPLLHKLLQWNDLQPHIYGGKGVGSQGDGTAQFVARSAEDRDEAMAMIAAEFPAMRCFPLTIGPGNGKH